MKRLVHFGIAAVAIIALDACQQTAPGNAINTSQGLSIGEKISTIPGIGSWQGCPIFRGVILTQADAEIAKDVSNDFALWGWMKGKGARHWVDLPVSVGEVSMSLIRQDDTVYLRLAIARQFSSKNSCVAALQLIIDEMSGGIVRLQWIK